MNPAPLDALAAAIGEFAAIERLACEGAPHSVLWRRAALAGDHAAAALAACPKSYGVK